MVAREISVLDWSFQSSAPVRFRYPARMSKYHLLATKLQTPEASGELRHALSEGENSRYVFAGMFGFKGLVAEVLYRYIPATGMQLQHALGNLFKNEQLERLFFYYALQDYIRHSLDFDASHRRHVFVYGLLGWLFVHANDDVKQRFIRRHFILPCTHILFSESKNRDMEAKCNLFSKMLYNCKISLGMEKSGEEWTTVVRAGETVLAGDTSTGYRYSRQKALKRALIALTEAANHADSQTPGYERRRQILEDSLLKKQESEKMEKTRAYAEKQEQKKVDCEKRKIDRKAQSIEIDIKRRKAKSAAKLRKEEQARQAAQKAAKMTNMSANKRRHLQDKGQLWGDAACHISTAWKKLKIFTKKNLQIQKILFTFAPNTCITGHSMVQLFNYSVSI